MSAKTPTRVTPRKRKLSTKVMNWIRRIHLFSGLFMLPWVLLYGFTALLFNHPTYMQGARTDIENFTLTETNRNHLPSAEEIARLAVAEANAHPDQSQMITLSEQPGAIFQRQAFGSLSSD